MLVINVNMFLNDGSYGESSYYLVFDQSLTQTTNKLFTRIVMPKDLLFGVLDA